MDASGSIDSVDLARFLEELCQQRANGVLTVRGPGGRSKSVEIAEGQIAVVTRGKAGRMRLGDLLVARGRINQEQLEEAVKAQHFHGRKLGEVIVELGFCSENDILECLRFQVEEEVSELLTWEEGRFDYKSQKTLAESGPGPSPDDTTTRLQIDGSALVLEAARRAQKWRGVEKHIPSINSVFELTEHGEKLRNAATRGGRKLLDLIAEGHNVEGIISRTFVGRFGVMKALSELIQSTAILEVTRAELPDFAQKLKRSNHYEQAIGAFNRLMEVTANPNERRRTMMEIRECEEALAVIAATSRIEKTTMLRPRHEGPIAPAPSGPKLWRPVTAGLVLALIILGGVAAFTVPTIRRYAVGESLTAYNEVKFQAGKLEAQGDYAGSIRAFEEYLSANPEGTGADLAHTEVSRVRDIYEALVKSELKRAGKLEAQLEFAKAIACYEETIEKFPYFAKLQSIRDRMDAARAKQAEVLRRLTEAELAKKLEQAVELERAGRLNDALDIFKEVARSSGDASKRARASVDRLDEVISRALSHFEAGLAHEKRGNYSLALASFKNAREEWPGSKWGRSASIHISNIQRRARTAKLLFDDARGLEKRGDITGALKKYLLVAESYKGFDQSVPAREKMDKLTGLSKIVETILAEAKKHESSGDLGSAFRAYRRAIDGYGGTAAVDTIRLPVLIHSVPLGARVKLDGRDIGPTPVEARFSPNGSGVIEMSLPGFEPLKKTYKRIRRRSIVYGLNKKPLFRAELGLRITGPAATSSGRILVPAERSIIALRRLSGREAWRRELFKALSSREDPERPGRLVAVEDESYWDMGGAPVIHGSRVFAAARDGNLHVIDASSGKPAKPIQLKAPSDSGVMGLRSELMAGKSVGYVADWKGNLECVDLAERSIVWTKPIGGRVTSKGTLAGTVMCFGTATGSLVAFDARTGSRLWETKTTGRILTPPASHGNIISFYSEGDGLYIVDSDGRQRASRRLPAHGEGWVAMGKETAVICQGSTVQGYSVDDARELWKAEIDGPLLAAPVSDGRRLYVGTRAGTVYCLGLDDGKPDWQFSAGSAVTSPMTISGGALYFGTKKGTFFALEIE